MIISYIYQGLSIIIRNFVNIIHQSEVLIMIVFEQNIVGKHTMADCEDGIVHTSDFIAVIDGSTSKTQHRIHPGVRNGRYCMNILTELISRLDADIDVDAFCQAATEAVHACYPTPDTLQREHPEERLCASAVVYSDKRKEVWMIGDCQCMIDGKRYSNNKPYEEVIASRRAEVFNQKVSEHGDMLHNGYIVHDYARDTILPDLVEAMKGENKDYAVIDGFPIYKEGVRVIRLADLPGSVDSHEVVLASDGYPFLCSSLEKSERKLKEQLTNDPFNIGKFKATKGLMEGNVSFDDRAYIRFSTSPLQRYFLTLSFDGTAYHGWQIQPNGMSAQQRLQECLSRVLRHQVEVTGAGRTDAGVHARVMVCHFDDVKGIDGEQLVYRLNQILPNDMACSETRPVDNDLHARFSAKKRTYRYFIHTKKDPFQRYFSVETHYDLDFPLMNKAAEWLLGVTDFKAFCKAGADNKTTICHLFAAHWVETAPGNWYFEISADRFLRNMVRAVVGTLFDVGRHRMTLEQFQDTVLHGSRSDSGESMPAKALFLWEVEYEK